MSRVNVLVAATPPDDMKAQGIAAAVLGRSDMTLVENRVVDMEKVGLLLATIPSSESCALVLTGRHADTEKPAAQWLEDRANLVVLRVDFIDYGMHIAIRDADVTLQSLLTALRALVDRAGIAPTERIARFQLGSAFQQNQAGHAPALSKPVERPLLTAATDWVHAVLGDAVARMANSNGDLFGLTVTSASVQDSLKKPVHAAVEPGIEAALIRALPEANLQFEPLAKILQVFNLSDIEFRLLLLALAPELDLRYQRCIGVLLDDLSRRVGTLGLYSALLGDPLRIRRDVALSGNLARWRVLDGHAGSLPSADEPLRVDPFLIAWILGDGDALAHDPRVRRGLRLVSWSGASLLDVELDRARASNLVGKLQAIGEPQWFVFAGDDASDWCALLELGSELRKSTPIRVDANRLTGLEVAEIEDSGLRLGRMARLTGRPLILDVTGVDTSDKADDALRLLFAAIEAYCWRASVICADASRIVRLLGPVSISLTEGTAILRAGKTAAIRTAAKILEVPIEEQTAYAVASQYPLRVDGVEQAMRLAYAGRQTADTVEQSFERFVAACKDVAAEGVSQFADRIDPMFELDDVVLPTDRKWQLQEIVNSVRFTSKVLDEWKFRERLPYGRGTTALFHGPSGTGKSMAALAVARSLGVAIEPRDTKKKSGVPVLRIDLSRVVSKYIGETEKNIDRVFADAHRSGAVVLIDEADALLGKRSEVKDAHDRYANIEVAYLLQKIENLPDDGLVILTTNLRQNIDAAFLRRLRFVVDFPRPDAKAREQIWRRCLPDGTHTLDDAAFHQLARKIDLTGGHIRQITLRAAFSAAAAESKKIDLSQIAYATSAEFAKLGLPPVEIDLTDRRRAA